VATARPGDVVIVSGPIGEHGITIMLARGELDIESEVTSDTAPLNGLVERLLDAARACAGLRDATRGGVATICNEVARAAGVAVVVDEEAVPVRPDVRGACELLGIDPLYVACEGRLVAVVDGDQVDAAWPRCAPTPRRGRRRHRPGQGRPAGPGPLEDSFGGTRIVDLLVGDPLPRIC
jgi:hydrogenase expression/formation protein HypE